MDTFFLFFHLVINPFYNKDKQVRDTGPGEPIVIYHRMKNISDSLYIYMYFLDFCASSISSNKSGKDMASLLQERLSKFAILYFLSKIIIQVPGRSIY
jgi:hypothetical protein